MKHGWNQQSAFYTSSEAIDRARDLRKKGQKVKITAKMIPTGKRISPRYSVTYTVWMWWKWKD